MDVFVLEQGDYGDDSSTVIGVYSTHELAVEHMPNEDVAPSTVMKVTLDADPKFWDIVTMKP